jgi:phosphotriesterase-related protein
MSDSATIVRTVRGDILSEALGACDAHEHLFLRTPILPGEEMTRADELTAEARALAAAGARAVVDWTPIGLGRSPLQLAGLAEASGLHVVAATGYHREAHYPEGHWVRREPVEGLADVAVHDLTRGMDAADWCGPRERPTEVRAGVIKLGAGYHRVSPLEARLFEAGAAAHAATGAPVCVHTEAGTHAPEILERLAGLGVPAERVVLAHLDRNPDAGLHAEIASAGAWLEYDGPGRARYGPDSRILDLIGAVAERGHAGRLLLGADTARRSSLRASGGGPGLDYLFRVLRPRLERELGSDLARRILVENPARAFAFAPR